MHDQWLKRFVYSVYMIVIQTMVGVFFFFSSRRRHTRWNCDWSSDVCSSDLQRLLWVGTATGAYVTLDGGKSWRRLGKNLPNVPVESMALSFAQRDLVVSTHGRGVWVTNVGPLEQMTDTLLAEPIHLFDVAPAY